MERRMGREAPPPAMEQESSVEEEKDLGGHMEETEKSWMRRLAGSKATEMAAVFSVVSSLVAVSPEALAKRPKAEATEQQELKGSTLAAKEIAQAKIDEGFRHQLKVRSDFKAAEMANAMGAEQLEQATEQVEALVEKNPGYFLAEATGGSHPYFVGQWDAAFWKANDAQKEQWLREAADIVPEIYIKHYDNYGNLSYADEIAKGAFDEMVRDRGLDSVLQSANSLEWSDSKSAWTELLQHYANDASTVDLRVATENETSRTLMERFSPDGYAYLVQKLEQREAELEK